MILQVESQIATVLFSYALYVLRLIFCIDRRATYLFESSQVEHVGFEGLEYQLRSQKKIDFP